MMGNTALALRQVVGAMANGSHEELGSDYEKRGFESLEENCIYFLEMLGYSVESEAQQIEAQQAEIDEEQQEQPEINEEISEDVEAPQAIEIDEAKLKEVRKEILLSLDWMSIKGIGEVVNSRIRKGIIIGTIQYFDEVGIINGVGLNKFNSGVMDNLRNQYDKKCSIRSITNNFKPNTNY